MKTRFRTNRQRTLGVSEAYGRALLPFLLLGVIGCSACGTGSQPVVSQGPATLSGGWQFTMAAPTDASFVGGLQGGFLLQTNNSATGSVAYSIALPSNPAACNSGSATITGTLTPSQGNQSVTLVAAAGTQTFTLTGTLSIDGSTMAGTYDSTSGTAADGNPCGTAQTGLQWSAVLVPTLTGSIQGSFHSTGGAAGLNEQEFLVTGALSQGNNVGAASALVTGNLNFLNPTTNLSDYPCFTTASVNGQISGDTVTLQIVGGNGDAIGLIGVTFQTVGATVVTTGLNPVIVTSTSSGYILSGGGPSYLVSTPPGSGPCLGQIASKDVAGDFGDICLAVNNTAGCPQPITLSPSGLVFPPQPADSAPTIQTVTLKNTSGATLSGLKLTFANGQGSVFTEVDSCGADGSSAGTHTFSLGQGESCTITVTLTPGSCTMTCGTTLTATLQVNLDNEFVLTLPITCEVDAAAASALEGDFGATSASQNIPMLVSLADLSAPTLRSVNANALLPGRRHHAEID